MILVTVVGDSPTELNKRLKTYQSSVCGTHIGQEKNIIIGFGDSWNEVNNTAAKEVLEYFVDNPEIGAVYTDAGIKGDDGILSRNYLPAWSRAGIITGQLAINTPFFVRADVLAGKVFDENLDSLYYFALLRNISANHYVSHIPVIGYHSKQRLQHLEHDIKILQTA